MLLPIFQILDLLLSVAFWIMIVHVVMSWLIAFNILNTRQPLVAQIWHGLNQLLEPVYRPIRRFLPASGGIDFAPLAVFLCIIILRDILLPAFYRGLV